VPTPSLFYTEARRGARINASRRPRSATLRPSSA